MEEWHGDRDDHDKIKLADTGFCRIIVKNQGLQTTTFVGK